MIKSVCEVETDERMFFYVSILLTGVLVSSISQILLKKSAMRKYDSLIKDYLNIRVVFSYIIFIFATFCTMYAYKGVPLSLGPVFASSEYIFVAVMSCAFLKEQLSKQKLIGLGLIVIGIVVCTL